MKTLHKGMEQLIQEIEAYAAAVGLQPTTVIQHAGCGGGGAWPKWKSGESACTLRTADRLRRYMADNPPPEAELQEAS